MRNLKRVLSLALAALMLMGMMVVGAGAASKDFTDASEIKNVEAVDVMVALGVLEGGDKGDFQPNSILTREQAAKIICYLLLGTENAEKLTTNSTVFNDVAANRWSAPYISYCVNMGILAGDGAGHFFPEGKLTGAAFAKMLLVALGYNADREDYVGSNWMINVSADAIAAGIAPSGLVLSADLSRQDAAQMAFDTLKATVVEYQNDTTIVVGGTTVSTSSKATPVAQGSYANTMGTANLQFAEKYFPDLKKTAGADAFGRPAVTWKNKNTNIGTYANTADATYTGDVATGDIYSDLGLTSKVTASVVRNGGAKSNLLISKGNVAKTGTGNGTVVEVYYDADANTVDVVEIDTYVAQVSTVKPATSKDDRTIVLTDKSSSAPANFNTHNTYVTEAFAEDDIVLYTYADNEIQSVALAKTVTGELTGRTNGKSVTVDGTAYSYSAMANANTLDGITVKSDVVLYLDTYGNVVWGEVSKEAASNYAYVLNIGADNWDNSVTYAKLLLADGTVVAKTAVKYSGNAPVNGDIVNYSVNDKGEYTLYTVSPASIKTYDTLAAANATALNNFKLTKGSADIDFNSTDSGIDVYANSKTVFVVATGDASAPTYTAYTGIANVPSISGKTGISYYCKTGNMLTFAVINATSGSVETDSNTVIFVDASSRSNLSINSDGEQYYSYDAVVNGKITTLNVLKSVADTTFGSNANSTDKLFTGVTYNTNGIAKAFSANATTVKNVNNVSKVDGNAIKLGNTYYSLASDVQVFYVDADDGLVSYSTGAIQANANDTAYFIYKDGEIKTLVVVSSAAASAPQGPGANANVTGFTVNAASGTATVTVTGTGFDNNSKISYTVEMLQNGKYVTVGTFEAAYSNSTTLTGSFPVVASTYYQVTCNGTVQVVLGA